MTSWLSTTIRVKYAIRFPGVQIVLILRMLQFLVKHSRPHNKYFSHVDSVSHQFPYNKYFYM